MISIIVPVYRSEKTLEGCLDSLLAQTFKDIEILCIVDGSPDSCGEICDAYHEKDPRVRVLKRANGGVSSARNLGIESARGEFLVFVDSDDRVEPDYCKKMWESQKMTGADLVICGFHHWYLGRDVEKFPKRVGVFSRKEFQKEFLELYQGGFLNMPWNKMIKKEKASRFPLGLSLGEDLLFNMDYLEQCERISVIPDLLYHYVQWDNGTSLSSKKRADKLEIAKRVCKRVQEVYEKLGGSKELHPVIAGRFVMEFLDDCQKLPFEKELSRAEKKQRIHLLAEDEFFGNLCQKAKVTGIDYEVLRWCFAHRWIGCVYPVCVCRKWAVQMVRCLCSR